MKKMNRKKQVKTLKRDFCFPLTEREVRTIMDKSIGDEQIYRFVRSLYDKYLDEQTGIRPAVSKKESLFC